MFQFAEHPHFNRYESERWVNCYREWQREMGQHLSGVFRFGDWPWVYEVTILSDAEWDNWALPEGWEAFADEDLIVGWQRNLTMSPEKKRPIRRIDFWVTDFYKKNLTRADYLPLFQGRRRR